MPGEVSHGRGGKSEWDLYVTTPSITLQETETDRFFQRGGAGNIDSPRVKPSNPASKAGDIDVVPEPALREPGPGYENYHTGRGGGGNVHKEKHNTETGEHEGLGEKIKHKVLGKKD
ncbi:MAG: hypothetical protein LQ341_000737 [Variospora aurantia]|nr:MAG: hypothetical protein LQ341_000737 [Variospora aurantia]